MGTHLRHAILVLICLAGLSMVCRAQEQPGVDLPGGELLIDMAWADDARLVLLVATDYGFGLRNLDLRNATTSLIATPNSFRNIKPDQPHGGPHFFMAPRGNALAVLEDSDSPLKPHELSVYRLQGSTLMDVPTDAIPFNFWPDQLAWDTNGASLYLGARKYLDPDQPYSIGRLDLATYQFTGTALKANIDLIASLVAVSGRDALVARCQGYQGEYPLSSMLVLVDCAGGHQFLLDSQADGLQLNALRDGRVIAYWEDRSPDEGVWLLPAGGDFLEPESFTPARTATIKSNRDGSWLAYLREPDLLRPEPPYLVLRQPGGKTVVTSVAVSRFEFSPAGSVMAAADESGRRIYFFRLPEA